MKDEQRFGIVLISARSVVKMLNYIFSCYARLLERLLSHQGFSFRMKKTHGASSHCIAMLQQNPMK